MKRTLLGLVALWLTALPATVGSAAGNAMLGTWKLKESSAHITPGAPKPVTFVFTAVGDDVKVTVDGLEANGKPGHNEWTGRFDGKDYAVSGDPASDMRAYKQVDNRNLSVTGKKAGKVTVSGLFTVSESGTQCAVSITTTDAGGKRHTSASVYDKQ